MRHRTKTQTYGAWLKIVKKTNPKTGRKHYSVIADGYLYMEQTFPADRETITSLYKNWRQHFDPAGNRGIKGALSWKFSNREEAEQLITMALLKWGERYVA